MYYVNGCFFTNKLKFIVFLFLWYIMLHLSENGWFVRFLYWETFWNLIFQENWLVFVRKNCLGLNSSVFKSLNKRKCKKRYVKTQYFFLHFDIFFWFQINNSTKTTIFSFLKNPIFPIRSGKKRSLLLQLAIITIVLRKWLFFYE